MRAGARVKITTSLMWPLPHPTLGGLQAGCNSCNRHCGTEPRIQAEITITSSGMIIRGSASRLYGGGVGLGGRGRGILLYR